MKTALALTGALWVGSMALFGAREIVPAFTLQPAGYYETLLRRLAPYEQLWYGIYYKGSRVGGLRMFYDVEEEGGQTMAVLRPSLWCHPLQAEGEIRVDTRFAWSGSRWDLRWGALSGELQANPRGNAIACSLQLGDMPRQLEISRDQAGMPALFPILAKEAMEEGWQHEGSLPMTAGAMHFKTTRQGDSYLCRVRTAGIQIDLVAGAKGIVQEVQMPLGLSMRLEEGYKPIPDTAQHADFMRLLNKGEEVVKEWLGIASTGEPSS